MPLGMSKDEWGPLVDPLPSGRLREGPLFEAVQRLLPVRTTTVQCNKFTSHEQCKFHVDKRNVGDSFLAILGDCEGGALRLADGRHFAQKRCWHVCNGSQVGHEVEPFDGERITLIAFNSLSCFPGHVSDVGVQAARRQSLAGGSLPCTGGKDGGEAAGAQ